MRAGSFPRVTWLLLLGLLSATVAFNVDTKNAVLHHMAGSYFGYSLDFYNEQKGMPILVVGAPEAETTNPNLAGIRRPGAVYACSVNRPTCREVHVDKQKGNLKKLNGSHLVPIEDKANQFFGATVKANDKHDKLLMCAPKYKYFYSKFEVIEPVGTCFYAENGFDKTEEFSSCKQEPARHGRHRLGYGQCGFSGAIPGKKNQDRIFLGAPGVWYWQGAIFSQNVKNQTDRPNTEYGSKEYDHDMMGYATATGDFDGDGIDDIVAGVPRGNDLHGKLVLYSSKLKIMVNLTDEVSSQHGQYCGAALAVADVNKDGRDDILMGCPFYTDYVTIKDAKTQERKPQYDVGKVIVFLQTAPGTFGKQIAVVGDDQWGRFGHSLASAGDLNLDGYNDVIVGAPYAGKNKQGAVYVIHGSKDGVREKPTQKIEATQIGHGTAKAFGFSVAGGVDVDGNGMPDIAVGAWKSGNAAVLLTKPVVTVTGQTEAESALINVEEKNCDIDQKLGKQSCRHINTCFKYEGKGDTPNDLEFDLRFNLDDHSPEPRAYFLQKDVKADRSIKVAAGSKTRDHPSSIEQRVRLEKGRQKCFRHRFFASSTMKDKLSPIHWSVNYTYVESRTGKLRGDKLEPAIDTTVPLSFQNKINIANNCGKDDLCVPDLKVTAVADREKFLLGTQDNTMLINVTVQNGGEDSYETKLYFDVPQGFEYGGIESVGGDAKSAPACSPTSDEPDSDGKWTFACDLGNPLPANKVISSVVRVTASSEKPPLAPISINAHVNSSNDEEAHTVSDNKVTFTIPVDFKNQLNLNGRSSPEQVDFSPVNRTRPDVFDDNEIGPVVSHLYQISNRGPSEIDAATLDIFWPSFSSEGGHLLYIITEPVVNPPNKGRCRVKQVQNVNPLNLRVTNEHVPTEPPVARTPNEYSREENDESYEDDASVETTTNHDESHHESHHESTDGQGGPVHLYERDEEKIKQNTGNWQYVEEKKKKGDYEYIPDDQEYDGDDFEDDEDEEGDLDRGSKRVKRNPTPKKKKGGNRGEPRSDKARFSDLRDAVKLSKEAGGVTDYKGPLSRATVDCNSLRCTHIECDIYDLKEEEFVLVEIFSRLYTNTLVDEKNPGGDISSLALARVTSTKYNLPHKPTLITAVSTNMNAIASVEAKDLPWWLYLLAILIGLLILILLILCLWRCGFFKRNRPPTEQAQLQADRNPDAHYADSKTRYAPGDQYNQGRHGQML
uniref:Integrin alpha pat-2 n=2 Tax=Caenorhabditis japonica TaxID=281687 RepID=A0A8R1HJH6_CAEJA